MVCVEAIREECVGSEPRHGGGEQPPFPSKRSKGNCRLPCAGFLRLQGRDVVARRLPRCTKSRALVLVVSDGRCRSGGGLEVPNRVGSYPAGEGAAEEPTGTGRIAGAWAQK